MSVLRWHFGVFIFFAVVLLVFGYDPNRSFGTVKLKYCNRKHLANCTVTPFVRRVGGVERSLCNISVDFLWTAGNNISVAFVYVSVKDYRYKLEHTLCDLATNAWVKVFMTKYSKEYNKIRCPAPPGVLTLTNMEIPPVQSLPVPMLPGEYRQEVDIFHTKTKERIMVLHTLMNIGRRKKPNKKH